jgi:hypothetical protein
MLHASHNLFIQSIFDQLTMPVKIARYLTTEFGLGLSLTVAITAVILWKTPRSE